MGNMFFGLKRNKRLNFTQRLFMSVLYLKNGLIKGSLNNSQIKTCVNPLTMAVNMCALVITTHTAVSAMRALSCDKMGRHVEVSNSLCLSAPLLWHCHINEQRCCTPLSYVLQISCLESLDL